MMASVTPSRHMRQKPISSEKPPQVIERITVEGRRLRYELTVIQQPERARACGSGAKSSADRRPVDPPPVVELKIFDVTHGDKNDITFAYDANFFLFVTLEMARPIAHGRMGAPSTSQVPVLTGMPVSGMAYLDRPAEAGYFIFPDLSVRHEGRYRLSFNLYEETKNPEKDADKDSALDTKPSALGVHNDPEACFDWRMEMKSDGFDVFSAKKFPGLAESTHLSRTVAEQGCRVRIRRDVRMRRRTEVKGEDYAEEEYERKSRAPTIDTTFQPDRSRSVSIVPETERRQSYLHQGNLPFDSHPYQAPPQYTTPQPRQFAAPVYRQPQPYNHTLPPQHYGYDRQYPQSAYPSSAPRDRMVEEDHYRRSSVSDHANEQHQRPYVPHEQPFNCGPLSAYSHSPSSPAPGLPPLQLPHLSGKYDGSPSAPLPSVHSIAPALHSPTYERRDDRAGGHYAQHNVPLAIAPASAPEPMTESLRGGKRSFDATFGAAPTNQPLYNGMRPDGVQDDTGNDVEDEDAFMEMQMTYKRADGGRYTRKLPMLTYG